MASLSNASSTHVANKARELSDILTQLRQCRAQEASFTDKAAEYDRTIAQVQNALSQLSAHSALPLLDVNARRVLPGLNDSSEVSSSVLPPLKNGMPYSDALEDQRQRIADMHHVEQLLHRFLPGVREHLSSLRLSDTTTIRDVIVSYVSRKPEAPSDPRLLTELVNRIQTELRHGSR